MKLQFKAQQAGIQNLFMPKDGEILSFTHENL
jgi:hypothetical protein